MANTAALLPCSEPKRQGAQLPTQWQHFYAAHRAVSDLNEEFLWLVEHGLTREDLQRCIERRPALWARFSGFLGTLPARGAPA